jgi:CubicO group peptidase (beta-lactamase class C family)
VTHRVRNGRERFGKARELLHAGLREKAYSAAVLLAARGEEVVFHASAGEASLSSVFDIASLTKPLVAALFFLLVQEGKLSFEEKLSAVLPVPPGNPGAGEIRFSHLLAHTSGLPAWKPLYKEVHAVEERERRRILGTAEVHDRIVASVLSMPLEAAPGKASVYSDLGFMLLGRALEVAAGSSLDRLLRRLLAEPLRMTDTTYAPLSGLSECETGRLISTGFSEERAREKVGEADDENAAAMGGVAGHAGIFSTAHDLFLFAREVLRARRGEGRALTRASAMRMTTVVAEPPGCRRTPGWDTPATKGEGGSQAGRHFPEGSFGHLGYTGCSLWIDPASERIVALFANRVYFGKQNDGLKKMRPPLHDAVMEEMGE